MKKLIAILLCTLMLLVAVACNVKVETSESLEVEELPETETQPETEPVTGTKVGGWTIAEDTAMTDKLKAIFEKALEGNLGVKYTPIACLGTQVVAGTNYCFLAQGTVVYPDAVPQFKLVYVYADLEAQVRLPRPDLCWADRR